MFHCYRVFDSTTWRATQWPAGNLWDVKRRDDLRLCYFLPVHSVPLWTCLRRSVDDIDLHVVAVSASHPWVIIRQTDKTLKNVQRVVVAARSLPRSTPTANELSVSARPKKRFLQCQKPCPKAVHRSRRLSVTPMTGNNNNNISSSNNNHRPASYSLTKYWFCPIACPLSLQRPSMTLWLWF